MKPTKDEARKVFTDVRLRDRFIRALGMLIDVYTLKHQDIGNCPLCPVARDAHTLMQGGEWDSECGYCPWMYFTGQDCDDYFDEWAEENDMDWYKGERTTISFVRMHSDEQREWAEHRLPMIRKWRKAFKSWK